MNIPKVLGGDPFGKIYMRDTWPVEFSVESGWPFVSHIWRWKYRELMESDRLEEIKVSAFGAKYAYIYPVTHWNVWIPFGIALNVLSCLGLLLIIACTCEYCIRRSSRTG